MKQYIKALTRVTIDVIGIGMGYALRFPSSNLLGQLDF